MLRFGSPVYYKVSVPNEYVQSHFKLLNTPQSPMIDRNVQGSEQKLVLCIYGEYIIREIISFNAKTD